MSDRLQRNPLYGRIAGLIALTVIVCGGLFVLIDHWMR
jgi:hypothetical protein